MPTFNDLVSIGQNFLEHENFLKHADLEDDEHKYGIPELKKFPMPDAAHVKSAIRFFNYVTPAYEKELARNIIKRIKEYNIMGINVGPDNRFKKYYKSEE